MKELREALRPKSLDTLWGQDDMVKAIRNQIASKRIPQCWMFVGETGSGKTTTAKILSMTVQCTHNTVFGSYCKKCQALASEHKANTVEIDGAKCRTVEAISNLIETANYVPIPPSLKRVFVIDEAHRLSKEAQSVLLSPTEHPPKSTVWILASNEAQLILKTLRRRCKIYPLAPLKHKVVEEFIKWAAKKGGIKKDLYDLIEYVHKEGVTSASIILGMLENYAAGMDPDKAAASAPTSVNTMRIAKAILAGEWGNVRPELDKATPEDVRLVRASVLGFFKHQMLMHTPNASRKLLAKSIESLGNIGYGLDDASQLALMVSRMWELTQLFNKG